MPNLTLTCSIVKTKQKLVRRTESSCQRQKAWKFRVLFYPTPRPIYGTCSAPQQSQSIILDSIIRLEKSLVRSSQVAQEQQASEFELGFNSHIEGYQKAAHWPSGAARSQAAPTIKPKPRPEPKPANIGGWGGERSAGTSGRQKVASQYMHTLRSPLSANCLIKSSCRLHRDAGWNMEHDWNKLCIGYISLDKELGSEWNCKILMPRHGLVKHLHDQITQVFQLHWRVLPLLDLIHANYKVTAVCLPSSFFTTLTWSDHISRY